MTEYSTLVLSLSASLACVRQYFESSSTCHVRRGSFRRFMETSWKILIHSYRAARLHRFVEVAGRGLRELLQAARLAFAHELEPARLSLRREKHRVGRAPCVVHLPH